MNILNRTTFYYRDRPLAGKRMLVCTHAKTASLDLLTSATKLGADVQFCPVQHSCNDDVVAELRAIGIPVITLEEASAAISDIDILLEDGARISRTISDSDILREGFLVIEQTTSGIRYHEAAGDRRFPIVNVADSELKRCIENFIATPEAVLTALLQRTGASLFGKTALILGYGPIGQGIAQGMRSHGSCVHISELSSVRRGIARAAAFEAHKPTDVADVLKVADFVVSATDRRDGGSIGVEDILLLKDGAILLNSGSGFGEFSERIRVPGSLQAHRGEVTVFEDAGDMIVSSSKNGLSKSARILAGGRSINLHGHPGTPSDAILMVFGLMVASAVELANAKLPSGIIKVPRHIEELVATLAEGGEDIPQPSFVAVGDVVEGERPFGTVAPISANGVPIAAKFSIARAVFRNGNGTAGHFHESSEEVYVIESGSARIDVWDPKSENRRWVFEVTTGDCLGVPKGLAHRVLAHEECSSLVIASPPFSFWDQFFPIE